MRHNDKISFKICIGYHRPSLLLNGDCFVPIWAGKDVSEEMSSDGDFLSKEERTWMEQHCVGDNTGDNISAKNHNYREATVLYWMWKNYDKLGDPDYVGFMQYRSNWITREDYLARYRPNPRCNITNIDAFPDDYQYKIGCTERELQRKIKISDVVVCASDVGESVFDYKKHNCPQEITYWQMCFDIINRDWPKYTPYVSEFISHPHYVWKNCFIMRKDNFFEYCPFFFDVLSKVDVKISELYKNMTSEQMRIMACISEALLGVFITYLKAMDLKITNIPLTYVLKPFESTCSLPKHISPVIPNAIPIVYIANENSVKYTAVSISSLIKNSSASCYYDIIILHDGQILKATQKRICQMGTRNATIRFFNALYYIRHYNFNEFFHRKSVVHYLKLFTHEILKDYHKAIFLDNNSLILDDMAKLYAFQLEGNLIGAAKDVIQIFAQTPFWRSRRDYLIHCRKIKDINNYKDTNVLLLDLDIMRSTPELLNKFMQEAKYAYLDESHHDQDVINFVLEKKMKELPIEYNYKSCITDPVYNDSIPRVLKQNILSLSRMNNGIKIIHYVGVQRPWLPDGSPTHLDDLWWSYARTVPFYEVFLSIVMSELESTTNRVVPEKYRSALEKLLSIKRVTLEDRKYDYKILTVFGLRFKFKVKKKISY